MRRLVVAHPKQLGKREASQYGICSTRQNGFLADFGIDGIHLRLAALIAPDERRPNDAIGIIQQDQPVHLAGKADASNVLACRVRLCQHATNRTLRRIPPVLWTLLGPKRAFHSHVFMGGRNSVSKLAALIDQKGARAARSHINAEPITHEEKVRPRCKPSNSCTRRCPMSSCSVSSSLFASAMAWASVPAETPEPAFNASVASRRTGSSKASPAISQSVMNRSTAFGKLTEKTP